MKNSIKNLLMGIIFACSAVSINADMYRFNEGVDDVFGGAGQVASTPATMWRRGDIRREPQAGQTRHEMYKERSHASYSSDEEGYRRPIRRGVRNVGQGAERTVYGAGEVITSPFRR